MRHLAPALWVMAASVLAAASGPLVGLAVNIPEGGTEKDLVQGLLTSKSLGVHFAFVGYKWHDLEPKPGTFELQKVDQALGGFASLGFHACIVIQTLDTNNRTLPADLQDKPFDSAAMRARFDALLDALAARLTDMVDCVLLANEADIYLKAHPEELAAFAGFAERGRERLRSLRPGLAAGVAVTFDNLRDRPQLVERLNRAMDVICFNYYPLGPRMKVRPVAEVGADFDKMVHAAGDKPLLFKEIGYPAAPLLGSSDQQQAAFVDAVFDAAERHAARIRVFNFFLLYDFDSRFLETLTKYYGSHDPSFVAYLGTLGLKRADGTPRPAWTRFEERARAFTATWNK